MLTRIAILSLPVISGCRDVPPEGGGPEAGDDGERFDHSALSVETVELSGEILVEHPVLGNPGDLVVTDSILWVSDKATDPSFHTFDVHTGELLVSFGRVGDGPGEFRSHPSGLHADPFGRGVWATDLGHNRLMFFEHDDPAAYSRRMITFPSHPSLGQVGWMTREHLMGINYSLDETLVKFDSLGNPVASFAREISGPEGTPEPELLEAWADGVHVCLRPTGDRLALAAVTFGRIDLYDSAGQLIREADAPFRSGPPFVRNEDTGEWKYRWSSVHYMGCTPSEEGFMLLFSGGSTPDMMGAGEWVHVFNWNGNLERVYHLDRRVNYLALSEDGATLFASSGLDATIVAYALGR